MADDPITSFTGDYAFLSNFYPASSGKSSPSRNWRRSWWHGGVVVAQEPADALFASMPRSAIAQNHVAYVLPSRDIATLVSELSRAV